ncbi:nitrous oxide reductase accessory protein NosL [Schinkia azotoformans]|uniref:NosL family protein n=1 Tax=Schinkia azotoformans LMG 9581 TaxID=1131731 RepID=K6D565_SCHAZ|nr:nitrous oxide reductase accessory protein NosL [Schinkia azotoformans]EKN63188.1 hypothetical protein BAZO_18086 [Schinkia azotoformans LMG 9581]MEC1637261.1 nitrous oxide reductase accessory protein NosL [Schinkia azotoformans]MEC1720709.1 nitrous oxide reductase accessory protein NosL [Schinkia azotoformans]MEC1943665.1 nitrous oxide reductase accessory protein NosL [Schinkia azotoformans]MED4411848.1 nitrous oxide reductase accessory protein NosL [Schinkia azotoformans]
MKKFLIVLSVFGLLTAVIAGCGTGGNEGQSGAPVEGTTDVEKAAMQETDGVGGDKDEAAQKNEPVNVAVEATEPTTETKCSMCDMTVYPHDHDMGKFTGQVVTADGEHLFTDDVGCLMNQIRVLEEAPQAAWVRDYNTLEWVPVSNAIPVRASIETPMKMGFALFGSEEAADKFVTENPMLAAVVTSMDDVDKIALERRKAKLAKMKAAEEKAAGAAGGQGQMQMDGQMNGNMNGQMNH